jgi:hypothetical protein
MKDAYSLCSKTPTECFFTVDLLVSSNYCSIYASITRNQNQLVAQYYFLFAVGSVTCFGQIYCAIFRESYAGMFQLRIVSSVYS